MPKLGPAEDPRRRWTTFLSNHRDVIAGMDFFVAPTVRFRLLYAWFVLDHVVVLGENHLRRLLREYVQYYNADRVHTSIGDAPEGRSVQDRPSTRSKVIGLSRVGGLHHRYVWTQAA